MVEDSEPSDSENGDPREKEFASTEVVPLGGTTVDVVEPGGTELSESVFGIEGNEALRNPAVTAATVAGLLAVANAGVSGVILTPVRVTSRVSVTSTTVTIWLVTVSRIGGPL